MKLQNLIPWHRSPNGSTQAAKGRFAVDLIMAAVAVAVFRNRYRFSLGSQVIGRAAKLGGGICGLLALGEIGLISRQPPKKKQSPPKEMTFKECLRDYKSASYNYGLLADHPLDTTTPNLKERSPLADNVGIISPQKKTLDTYKTWFSDPERFQIPVGSYYFYQKGENIYEFHLLKNTSREVSTWETSFTYREEEIVCGEKKYSSFQTWINHLAKEFSVEPNPINYLLLVDMQTQLLTKFLGKGEREDSDWRGLSFSVEMDAKANGIPKLLSENPLHRTLKLKGVHQGLRSTDDFTISIAPYRVSLVGDKDELKELWELKTRNEEKNEGLSATVSKVDFDVTEAVGKILAPSLRKIPEENPKKERPPSVMLAAAKEARIVTSLKQQEHL